VSVLYWFKFVRGDGLFREVFLDISYSLQTDFAERRIRYDYLVVMLLNDVT
jgi:hypothetical protein